jgi:hypothetical protein
MSELPLYLYTTFNVLKNLRSKVIANEKWIRVSLKFSTMLRLGYEHNWAATDKLWVGVSRSLSTA